MILITLLMSIKKVITLTSDIYKNNNNQVTGIVDRPYIPLLLKYKHKISNTPVNCLLDSGSDCNLFPASWAAVVGINVRNGVKKRIRGIGGSEVIAYTHKVELIYDKELRLYTDVDFSSQQNIPLLGREGFFDKFDEISFDLKNNCFTLIFKK